RPAALALAARRRGQRDRRPVQPARDAAALRRPLRRRSARAHAARRDRGLPPRAARTPLRLTPQQPFWLPFFAPWRAVWKPDRWVRRGGGRCSGRRLRRARAAGRSTLRGAPPSTPTATALTARRDRRPAATRG